MNQKIAVPVVNGNLSDHFGHCDHFVIADIESEKVAQLQEVVPPPHAPGVIPKWLKELGVDVVLVGGIGQKAINLFKQMDVEPVIGVPSKPAAELIDDFLAGKLETGINQCSH